jgi:hypothetical protein
MKFCRRRNAFVDLLAGRVHGGPVPDDHMSRQTLVKIALVAAIALICAALVPRASAGLSDTEITAAYCMGAITDEIAIFDRVPLPQPNLAASRQYIRYLEEQVSLYERALAPYEQATRACPLTARSVRSPSVSLRLLRIRTRPRRSLS